MSEDEDTVRQQNGSPLRREVDSGGRTERRHSSPLDPEATRDGEDDDDDMVERGGRTRDTVADDVHDDDAGHRSFVQHGLCSPPIQQRQMTGGMAAATSRIRSTVSRPVQLQLMGESSGSGMLRLCRPQRSDDGESSTNGAQRGASAETPVHTARDYVVDDRLRSSAVHGVSNDFRSSTDYRQQCYRESSEHELSLIHI